MMLPDEERQWSEVLKRCGLRKHPKKLSRADRKLQLIILNRISDNPHGLPETKTWFAWWEWHQEQDEN